MLYGFGDNASFVATDLPDPVAGLGQVLVRIVATSVNPIECKLRRHGGPVAPDLPALLGSDLAGHVVAIGPGVDRFAPGDAVFGYIGGVRGNSGAYAQMAAVDARLLAAAPRSIPLAHAAALPLAGITAAEALERSCVGPGDTVLILGATGGVGHLAVQMAKALGANVHAGVSSSARIDQARALGADVAFVTDQETPIDHVERAAGEQGYDALIDCTSGTDLTRLFGALRDGGHLVSLTTRRTCDLETLSRKALSLHAVFVPNALLSGFGLEVYGKRIERIAALVDAQQLVPRIEPRTFTLDNLGEAHARLEGGNADGKILVCCER